MLESDKFSSLAVNVDWSRSALGDAAAWPPSLRLTLDIVFKSPQPVLLCWGPERVVVFNEAYAALAGQSHPAAPGGSVPAILPAPLAAARAAFDQALGGAAVRAPHQALTFIGAAGPLKRECDLYFTPIRDDRNEVRGVLCALAPSAPADKPPAAAGLRILVVEDNLDSQFLVCEMLTAFGHANDGVAHAEDALEKLAGAPYNVLFTDVSLPGMSGVELARRAVRDDPQLKVIFASGYGDSLLRQLEFPYLSLQKPYEIEHLQKALADIDQQLQRAAQATV